MKKYLLIILLIVSGLEPVAGDNAFAGKQPGGIHFCPENAVSMDAEKLTADCDVQDEASLCNPLYTLHQKSKVGLFIPSNCNKVSRGFVNNPFSPPDAF